MDIHCRTHRRGFTMVELMVVIAIISLLMTLTVGAMFSFIGGAREAATATTIAKVNHELKERVAGFRQMDFTDAAQLFATTNSMSIELAEIIIRKFRLKRAFPQNLTELNNDPQRFSSLITTLTSPPAGYLTKYESGIILYAVLTSGETFGALSINDDLFSSSEIRISTETAKLPCLVDSWGEPLRFYRWPTRLFKTSGTSTTLPIDRTSASLLVSNVGKYYPYIGASPDPTQWYGTDGLAGSNGVGGQGAYGSDDIPNVGPDGLPGVALVDDDGNGTVDDKTELGWPGTDDFEPLSVDPDDPLFLLLNALNTANLLLQFEQGSTTGTPNLSLALHTPFTCNPMLVVSAGPDRQLGLSEPNDTANFGYLASPIALTNANLQLLFDDISNLNLSSSGK